MILDIRLLNKKYKLNINGLLHIGAHFGQEIDIYKQFGIKDVILFEPTPYSYFILQIRNNNIYDAYNLALGNHNKKIYINSETANNGQSNSILDPKLHLKLYPQIVFSYKIEAQMVKLDDFMREYHSVLKNSSKKFNFIVIDVQGYELEVFKGACQYLNNIDYIITEVNKDFLYDNCAIVDDLDNYLSKYNFERIETNWIGGAWGDAFYKKIK